MEDFEAQVGAEKKSLNPERVIERTNEFFQGCDLNITNALQDAGLLEFSVKNVQGSLPNSMKTEATALINGVLLARLTKFKYGEGQNDASHEKEVDSRYELFGQDEEGNRYHLVATKFLDGSSTVIPTMETRSGDTFVIQDESEQGKLEYIFFTTLY